MDQNPTQNFSGIFNGFILESVPPLLVIELDSPIAGNTKINISTHFLTVSQSRSIRPGTHVSGECEIVDGGSYKSLKVVSIYSPGPN